MLVELPDHFDYDVSEIRFRVDGKDAKAVVRSLRTPEGGKALRAFGESPDVLAQATFVRALVVSLDCCYKDLADIPDLSDSIGELEALALMDGGLYDVTGVILYTSDSLRDVIYNEAAQLAAKFNAKKKS